MGRWATIQYILNRGLSKPIEMVMASGSKPVRAHKGSHGCQPVKLRVSTASISSLRRSILHNILQFTFYTVSGNPDTCYRLPSIVFIQFLFSVGNSEWETVVTNSFLRIFYSVWFSKYFLLNHIRVTDYEYVKCYTVQLIVRLKFWRNK